MNPEISRQIAALRREGSQRYKRWNPTLFDVVRTGPFTRAAEYLAEQPDATPVLLAYLELLREAIAQGYLRHGKIYATEAADSFLEYLLVGTLPEMLLSHPPHQRVAAMARAWNLAEGLWHEPVWMDRFLLSQIGKQTPSLAGLDGYIQRALEQAFAELPAVAWNGPFNVSVLDLRSTETRFLPGAMRWVGPRVLCVADRLRPEVQIGVFFRAHGEQLVLGVAPDWGGTFNGTGTPPATVEWTSGNVRIGERQVAVRFLETVHSTTALASGFLVASAVDSQRLWIVESTT